MNQPTELHHRPFTWLATLLILSSLLFAACGGKPTPTLTPTDEPPTPTLDFTSTPVPTDTPSPTDTPTPQPLGSAGNPLQFGYVLAPGQAVLPPAAALLTTVLSKDTGYTIQAKPAASYRALLAGMQDGTIHLAFLPPFTYLQANKEGEAKVLLVSNHFGVYAYGAAFMANIFDGYTPFFDPTLEKNLGDASQALTQFSGKRPCLVEPHSGAGYVLPLGILNQAGITTQDAVIAQSFIAVVRALYVRQICDFGVTYAIAGDPRTASAIQTDMPDAVQKVIIVWRSGAVIPNLNVSTIPQLPADMTHKLSTALVALARSDDGKKQLSSAAGDYAIDDLKPIGDDFYDALRPYVTSSGTLLDNLLGN